ncbi:hypothetical protein BDY21DRAFT_370934 [Lineolata rhizophorae]|uniref:Uncharacterized protein n=1 Tax=Lineolata rhizophorae TaxID=578093 RepID=A0A6A6P4U5_9PEZI|nr:hypothetical protein BDY21DRAFT_370934 [Lineolata rhizophorae]
MPQKTRPVERIAAAVAKCPHESAAYGKCVLADYNNMSKDKCLAEFLRLKECFTAAMKKR